jgi:hypothetical protein
MFKEFEYNGKVRLLRARISFLDIVFLTRPEICLQFFVYTAFTFLIFYFTIASGCK